MRWLLIAAAAASMCAPTLAPAGDDVHVHGQAQPREERAATEHGSDEIPGDLDTSAQKVSDGRKFRVELRSKTKPVTINKMHSWILGVKTLDGNAAENARIEVDGGMPQHGHGLPTAPRVTEYLGDGDYLVEGVRFNMTGWWELKFRIEAGGDRDDVTFNLALE